MVATANSNENPALSFPRLALLCRLLIVGYQTVARVEIAAGQSLSAASAECAASFQLVAEEAAVHPLGLPAGTRPAK
jgi:hypothetical protein